MKHLHATPIDAIAPLLRESTERFLELKAEGREEDYAVNRIAHELVADSEVREYIAGTKPALKIAPELTAMWILALGIVVGQELQAHYQPSPEVLKSLRSQARG